MMLPTNLGAGCVFSLPAIVANKYHTSKKLRSEEDISFFNPYMCQDKNITEHVFTKLSFEIFKRLPSSV
jgi:hypothetical protein